MGLRRFLAAKHENTKDDYSQRTSYHANQNSCIHFLSPFLDLPELLLG